MVKLKREVSASLFRCTHRNSIARSVPDISRMFPDYPGSFLIVITFSVSSRPIFLGQGDQPPARCASGYTLNPILMTDCMPPEAFTSSFTPLRARMSRLS